MLHNYINILLEYIIFIEHLGDNYINMTRSKYKKERSTFGKYISRRKQNI